MRPRAYVSGPISLGNPVANFAQFAEAFYQLESENFSPFNPGLTMLLPGNHQLSHRRWLEVDLPWVAVANVVYRLPGESVGADEETDFARTLGVPVYTKWSDLLAWRDQWNQQRQLTVANGT